MYKITKRTLKNANMEKTVPVIEFNDLNMAIVAEFLMADSIVLGADLLRDIDLVLQEKVPFIKTGGNRCGIIIKKEITILEDLYQDNLTAMEILPAYEIDTTKLKDLIIMWKKEREKCKN